MITTQVLTVMKENITWIRSMGMGFSSGKVEIYIKGTIKMMKGMAMEKCTGQMVLLTKESGKEVYNMDMV